MLFQLFLRTHIHCLQTRNCSRKSLKPNIEKKGAAHIFVDNSLIKKVILAQPILSESAQLDCEMAHQRSFPFYGYTAGNGFAAVVDILQSRSHNLHVIVGINSARNAKAHQIETAKTVFARHRITVGQHVAYLTRADSSLKIKLTCKRLGRKFFLWHPVEHLVSVYEDGMATSGALIRNAVFIEQRGEILNLVDAVSAGI